MKSGVALALRKRFPSVYKADSIAAKKGFNVLGNYSFSQVLNDNDDPCIIVNLYSQDNYGHDGEQYLRYGSLAEALTSFAEDILMPKWDSITNNNKTISIGVPYLMGCDRVGGDWPTVLKMLLSIEEVYPIEFVIHKLQTEK